MTELNNRPEITRQAQQFMEALPYAVALGMRIDELADGVAVITMPWAKHLIGDPRTGVIHGGVVSALMDTCSGAAVLSIRRSSRRPRRWIFGSTICARQRRASGCGRARNAII